MALSSPRIEVASLRAQASRSLRPLGGALTSASGAGPPPRPVALSMLPGTPATQQWWANFWAGRRSALRIPGHAVARLRCRCLEGLHAPIVEHYLKSSPLSTTSPRCFPVSVMLLVRLFGEGDGGVRDWNVLKGLLLARIGAERRKRAASKAKAGMTRGERGELRRRWLGSVEASQAGSVSSAWKGSTPVRRTARRRRSSSQARRLPSCAKKGRAPKRIRRATDSLRRTSTPPPGATV